MVPVPEETAPPPVSTGNGPRPHLWSSVVRGGAETVSSPTQLSPPQPPTPPPMSPPPPENIDNPLEEGEIPQETSDNAGQPRRPVWNTSSNGATVVESGPIMGGVAWPALSESTRPVPRSWAESTRPVGDGSVSTSQAPIIAQPPPQRTTHNNSQPHPAANNTMHTRPRSRNRGGGSGPGGPSQQHNFSRPAAPVPAPVGPPFPVFEAPPYGMGMVPPIQDASVRGPRAVVGNSQAHPNNDQSGSQPHRNRRGNFGPRPRGEGQFGRREVRGDIPTPFVPPMVYIPPAPMPMPPPGTGPFMPGQHMRFAPQMGGFEMAPMAHFFYPVSPEAFRPMAMNGVPVPAAPMIFPPVNESPVNLIARQIDYYFSDDNLAKDRFLKKNMDENGWVPVRLVASFPRVQNYSNDINEVLEGMRNATLVEVQDEKLRRRNEWSRWLPKSSENSGPQTPSAVTDVLATSMEQVSLDDCGPSGNGSLLEEKNDESRLPNGEEDAEAH